MWINFARDATARIEDLLAVNRNFLQAVDPVKFAADAAAELRGIALGNLEIKDGSIWQSAVVVENMGSL